MWFVYIITHSQIDLLRGSSATGSCFATKIISNVPKIFLGHFENMKFPCCLIVLFAFSRLTIIELTGLNLWNVLDGRSVSLSAAALNLLLFSLRCKIMLPWFGYSVLSWQKVGGKALAGTWEAVIQHYQTGFSTDFLEPAATVSSSRLALYYDLNYFLVLIVAAFLRLAFMVVGQPQSPVFCSLVRKATLCKKCLPSPVFAK